MATTTATFNYIDTAGIPAGEKPWGKVDADVSNYKRQAVSRPVADLRGLPNADFTTDSAGFAVHRVPTAATEATFLDDAAVRGAYYDEIEALLRKHLPDSADSAGQKVSKVVIFDHTIRRRTPDAPRGPVQQVHVDQTAAAAAARVRRHVRPAPEAEVEALLRGRYQIVNVWRPIGHPASEYPLAVVDWRTTAPADFVPVDLLYPKRDGDENDDGEDDRGRERRPHESTWRSLEGYEVRGETMGVLPSPAHRFYYARDMTPDEVLLLKCYDSFGEGEPLARRPGIAVRTPHTAFVDPLTPGDAKPRQSIEVRCLVFYE